MNTALQDLRYGARLLYKSPGFTVVALLSLALGIGANTVIFSVVNAILLKSLPYAHPESLVLLWGDLPAEGNHRSQVSATDVDDWRSQNHVFEEVTTYANWNATFLGDGEPERIQGMQVGDGYFQIMKGNPLLGRVFLQEEQQPGKDNVIVLGFGLWKSRFGANPKIIGQTVNLSGKPYSIVGVMPADFRSLPSTLVDTQAQFYRPVAEPHDDEERSARHLRAIARLKAGTSIAQAQSEMNTIASRIESEHPVGNTGYGVRLVTLTEDTVGRFRITLFVLLTAVGLVLLIACANVGNLLLARSAVRQTEIAIRAALGASRSRLVRQAFTESLLLSILGGALGLLLSLWAVGLIEALGSQLTPLLNGTEIDLRVLGFTLLIAVLAGILFGLAPARHVSRVDLNEALKGGGRSSGASDRSNRLRGTLAVAEIAMAIVLLICAGLLIRSVIKLQDVNPGFSPTNLITMNVALPESKYPTMESQIRFFDQASSSIELLPEVEAAGFTSVLPFSSNFDGRGLAVEDLPRPLGQELDVDLYITTPGYLKAMRIAPVAGRTLDDHDTLASPLTALVNEKMAQSLWPEQNPIGKRVKFPGSEKTPEPWRTVVGVVKNVKQYGLDREDKMQLYLPEAQYPTSQLTMVTRTTAEPRSVIPKMRNCIFALDKDQPLFEVATMEQLLSDSIALRRFSMLLLLVFAGLAMVLSIIGIYGVISYSVTQRTREIGVRLALGARGADILKMVVGQGMVLTATGILIGVIVAFVLTRILSNLLYGISPTDPLVFVFVPLVLAAVALSSCLIPAYRATKVNPIVALRFE